MKMNNFLSSWLVSKAINLRIWTVSLCLGSIGLLSAQEYCLTKPFGYGASATGGGNATPTLVDTESELKDALGKSGNRVIIITDNITVSSQMSVKNGNFTLLALPGKRLINLTQTKDGSGIMNVKSCSNVIIRNVTFEGPGAYDCDGRDLLQFEGVTNAWVDHCDFQDGCDGNFDNKNVTDNITVSWCRFRYLKAPKSGGSGGTNDHRFTNLIGSSSSDKPSDGRYNITWAYCWWDQGCVERMTRCRNADLHFLNCYWNSSVAKCYIGPENVKCYLDGCTMEGSLKTESRFKSYGGTNGLKSVGSVGVPSNTGSVSAPTYAYTALSAAEGKAAVTDATCGAGATLMVTAAGDIYSTCSSSITTYTVTFKANGGSGSMAAQTVKESLATPLNANQFTRSGYAFQGWATSAGSSTVAYADKASVTLTNNLTLYAVWKEATTYTVQFNANGGSCATSSLVYTEGGEALKLPVPTYPGYICKGWYTAATGGTLVGTASATYTPTKNITLYAQWEVAPPCTLYTYFVNNSDLPSGMTNTDRFSGTAAAGSDLAGSITIDGTTFSTTRRTSNSAHAVSFTVKSSPTPGNWILFIDLFLSVLCLSRNFLYRSNREPILYPRSLSSGEPRYSRIRRIQVLRCRTSRPLYPRPNRTE